MAIKTFRKRIRTKYFLYFFIGTVTVLGIGRRVWPRLSAESERERQAVSRPRPMDSIEARRLHADTTLMRPRTALRLTDTAGRPVKSRIYSVPDFKRTFPDLNDVQLATAERWGVPPVPNREAANRNKQRLVYIGGCPFYRVQTLHQSIPYLVPSAAVLLEHVARTFIDSLAVKGIPFHKLIVTSVLRTEEDVARLRNFNLNASTQSCHRYGTTFDISYNRYDTVEDPDGPERRRVRNDSLKWVLSEVLRDAREEGLCYVKYEVKQGCFHITAR